MSENRIYSKAFIPYLISCISYLASYLFYVLVPSSELANGLEHPGITAVYVLTASPVLAVVTLILLVVTFFLNKDYISNLVSKPAAVTGFAVLSLMVAVSVYFTVSFVTLQYKLGFAAPIYGTKWSGYAVYILVSVILQFISLLLVTLKMKGIFKNKQKA